MGFVVLTAVVMKSSIFWDITLCSPLKVNRHFGGTYRLHLQVQIHRARYQCEYRVLATWFHAGILLRLIWPWRWRRMFLQNVGSLSTDYMALYGSQDSTAGIATGYGPDDWGVRVQVPVGSRIFSSPHRPDQLWDPPNFLSSGYQG
jgi:hypothetical protein